MRIIARYFSTLFVKNFLLAVLALGFLYFFQALSSQLLDREFTTYQIIVYNLLSFPKLLVQMAPPAVMMATLLTLSTLNRSNELIACYSIGIGLQQIIMVILPLAFIISCFTLVLQDRILPPMYRIQTSYYWKEMKGRSDFHLDVKKDKIWYRSRNLIYNLRTFDPQSNSILGMAVYAFNKSFQLVQVIDAARASYGEDGWTLLNGSVTVFEGKDQVPTTRKFDKKALLIDETPQDFMEIEKEIDGLRLKELFQYIKRIRDSGVDTKSYEVKFHSKVSLSFIPMIMCILALPFAIRSSREGSLAKDIGICLVVTFFYWLFYSVALSLGTTGALAPWLAAWLPSLVFGMVAVTLVTRKRV